MPGFFPNFILILLIACAPFGAVARSDSSNAISDISILAFTPDEADCLSSHPENTRASCLSDLNLPPARVTQSSPSSAPGASSTSKPTNDSIWGWLNKTFDLSALFTNNYNQHLRQGRTIFGPALGLILNARRVADSDVLLDPDKVATDQLLSAKDGPGVWVEHDVGLSPNMNTGWGYIDDNLLYTTYTWADLTTRYTDQITFTKRHPMDGVYNDGFWGYAKQDLKALRQSIPLSFSLPLNFKNQNLLPGEEMAVERFATIELYVGTMYSMIAAQMLGPIHLGLIASAGVDVQKITGHFKTTVHMGQNESLRVVLENKTQSGTTYSASLRFGEIMGVFNATQDIATISEMNSSEHNVLEDLTFDLTTVNDQGDLKFPEAQQALLAAYSGHFAPAQLLAAQYANGVDHGVHRTGDQIEDDRARQFQASFFSLGTNVTFSHIHDSGTLDKSAASPNAVNQDLFEVEAQLNGFNRHRDLQFAVEDDLESQITTSARKNRFLTFRYQTENSKSSRDEILEILDSAPLLFPRSDLSQIKQMRAYVVENGEKGFSLKCDNFVRWGLETFATTLTNDPRRIENFYVAWATLMGIPNPQSWYVMTDRERRAAVRGNGYLSGHLKAAAVFANAMQKSFETQPYSNQPGSFVGWIKDIKFDVYALAALTGVAGTNDPDDLMSTLRLTIQADGDSPKTLGLQYVGSEIGKERLPLLPKSLF